MVGAAKRELTRWKSRSAPKGSEPLHDMDQSEEKSEKGMVDKAMYKAVMDAPEAQDRTWGSSRLTQLVSNLSEPQRVVMELAFIEDLTVTEIAAMEKVSVAAISQRKALALQLIERQIDAGWAA